MSAQERGAQTVPRDHMGRKLGKTSPLGKRSLWCRTQNGLEQDMPSQSNQVDGLLRLQ